MNFRSTDNRLGAARMLGALVLGVALLMTPNVADANARLAAEIEKTLRQPAIRKATVAVKIVKIGDRAQLDTVLYQRKSDIPLLPASNMKLITTAAALRYLGEDFEFVTRLMLHDGNLHLWGDGDPTFGDTELLRSVGWGSTTVFGAWGKALKERNIKAVNHVFIDDSIFDSEFINEGWPADQLNRSYCAEVGGMNLNINCVDIYMSPAQGGRTQYKLDPPTKYLAITNRTTIGSKNSPWGARNRGSNKVTLRGMLKTELVYPFKLTVHDPGMYSATVFAETIHGAGVQVNGEVKRDLNSKAGYLRDKNGWQTVGVHKTPIGVVLARCNKDSENLYAEALCKRIGHELTKKPGSWANGGQAILAYLKEIGVNLKGAKIADGSGLSRGNAVSADAFTAVLVDRYRSKQRKMWMDSLAVAGVDGTLDDRFKQFPQLRKRVFAKSGYIRGVRTLSGYVQGKKGTMYAFSILMNNVTTSGATAKQIQEQILAAIE